MEKQASHRTATEKIRSVLSAMYGYGMCGRGHGLAGSSGVTICYEPGGEGVVVGVGRGRCVPWDYCSCWSEAMYQLRPQLWRPNITWPMYVSVLAMIRIGSSIFVMTSPTVHVHLCFTIIKIVTLKIFERAKR